MTNSSLHEAPSTFCAVVKTASLPMSNICFRTSSWTFVLSCFNSRMTGIDDVQKTDTHFRWDVMFIRDFTDLNFALSYCQTTFVKYIFQNGSYLTLVPDDSRISSSDLSSTLPLFVVFLSLIVISCFSWYLSKSKWF